MGLIAVGIILILATIVLPFVTNAGTNRTGNSVTIERSERVAGDLNVVSRDADIDGTVTGDASIAAATIDVSGTIEGALNIAGGEVNVSGEVGRSVRIAGGDIEITGRIAGDLVILGGNVKIPSQAQIGGDLLVAAGQVDIRGTVTGKTTIRSANVTIGGTLKDDTDISASSLELLGPARLSGDLTYASSSDADIAPSAVVSGATTQEQPSSITRGRQNVFNPWLRVIWALVAGVVIVAIAPRAISAAGRNGRQVLPAFGIGIGSIILIPILSILLMVSVVGLPIGLAILTLFALTLYFSQIVVGLTIGRLILSGRWDDGSRGFNLLCMTLGVLIISGLKLIPVPYLWMGVSVIVTIWGVGATVMLLGRLRSGYGRPTENGFEAVG